MKKMLSSATARFCNFSFQGIRLFFALGLCCFGFLPLNTNGQITINAQLPPAGMVQKEQLWNLILVNNKEDIQDVNIKMSLQEAATGQVVMTANSGNLLLGKGVKIISSRDVQPVMYNYNVPDFSGNYIPMGAYIACYQAYHADQKGDQVLGDDCIRINIDPLSPPLLNTPADKSEVETPYPQFVWMPPTPFDMFSNLNYDIIITEVMKGQSSTEAIQYNIPVYSKSYIVQPYESYASSFTSLDTGKIYAWQVVARNGISYEAKTEVWTFKIKPPSFVKLIIEQTPFIKLKRDYPEKGIAPNSILKLSYINETTDSIATIRIIDLNSQSKNIPEFTIHIQPGENLIQYNLKKLISLEEGKIYEAQIINSRKEKWVMHFEARYYNDKKTERN